MKFARTVLFICSLGVSADLAVAQQTGGNGGTGTGTGTGSAAGTLNPENAFNQVERGSTVGASSETVQGLGNTEAAGGATGGRAAGGFGGLGGIGLGGLGGLGFGGFGGLGGATTNEPAIRTRLRSAVDVAPLPSAQIQQSAQSRFYRSPASSKFNGVQVQMVEGTAVLRGVVTSEKDRRMSELLMRLEPGVRQVANEIVVADPRSF